MDNKKALEILTELSYNTIRAGSRGTGKSQVYANFLEAIAKAGEALEKQIPILPYYSGRVYGCPCCDMCVAKDEDQYKPLYCDNCGQRLDWDLEKIKGEIVHCGDCKHLMFSDCYGECSKAHKGVVNPDDWCPFGELKDRYKNSNKKENK